MSVVPRVLATFLICFVCVEAVSVCRPSTNLAFGEAVASDLCTLCEDSARFVDYLNTLAPSRAMILLTEPLIRGGANGDVMNLRNVIVEITSQYENEFSIILRQLKGFKHLAREDLMISALLHFLELLPDSCYAKPSIIETVNYVILKKYLYGRQPSSPREYEIDFQPDLNQLISIVNGRVKNLGSPSPGGMIDIGIDNELIWSAIQLIPRPRTQQEQLLYDIIIKLFTDNISIFPSLTDISFYRTPEELLTALVRILVEQSHSPVIRQIFTAYFGLYTPTDVYGFMPDKVNQIIEMVPLPSTTEQMSIYDLITTYIREVYPYFSSYWTEETSPVEMLRLIAKYVLEEETRPEIKHDFTTYLFGIINQESPKIFETPEFFIPRVPNMQLRPSGLIPSTGFKRISDYLTTRPESNIQLIVLALELIPQPVSSRENVLYEEVLRIFQEYLPIFIQHFQVGRYNSPEEILQEMIQIILERQASPQVINTIREYFQPSILTDPVPFPPMFPSPPMLPSPPTFPSLPMLPSPSVFPTPTRFPSPSMFPSPPMFPSPSLFPSPPIFQSPPMFSRTSVPDNDIYQLTIAALRLIPQPQTTQDTTIYNYIINFLQSRIPYITSQIDITRYRTPQDLLNAIIEFIIENENDTDIIQYLITYNMYENVNYSKVLEFIRMIPMPETQEEQFRYEVLIRFLKSTDLTMYIPEYVLSNTRTPQELFMTIVSTLLESNVDERVKEALIYFALKNHPLGVDIPEIFSLVPGTNIKDYDVLLKYLLSPDILNIGSVDFYPTQSPQERLKYLLYQLMNIPNIEVQVQVQSLLKKLLTLEHGVDLSVLIPMIPRPTSGDTNLYNSLIEFLSGPDIYNIISPEELVYTNEEQLLEIIIQLLIQRAPNANLREIGISYYPMIVYRRMGIDIDRLLSLLPTPVNPEGMMKVAIVRQFLLSIDAAQIIRGLDINRFTSDEMLLDFILRKMVEYPINREVVEALWYVINMREELENIDLITTKEIRKHFKLTDIFKDTLPIEGFSGELRNAFRIFFDFVTEASQPVMSGFVTWDQARSRAEFMKLLFSYFLESPGVPVDVKLAVSVLDPLIIMSGRGALPP